MFCSLIHAVPVPGRFLGLEDLAVRMECVEYAYPDGSKALDGVSLKVVKGERVAVLGPNGAGKSTLLMLIDGLYTPSKGSVEVLGMPVEGRNLAQIRRRVGLVFQEPDNQLFCPTLWEDVTFGPLNMGLPEDEVRRRAGDALKAVRLEGFGGKPPHHLSVGEKRRAAIATVLAMKPDVLILDEPTANLDPESRVELVRLLNDLHKGGEITLIVATHDVNFVPAVAGRVYVLNRGRTVAEGVVRDIFSNFELMKKASLEPPVITRLFTLLNAQGSLTNPYHVNPLPLTVEEALQEITRLLKASKP